LEPFVFLKPFVEYIRTDELEAAFAEKANERPDAVIVPSSLLARADVVIEE
jgi:hypothetical protein